jgi:hypothetical protein
MSGGNDLSQLQYREALSKEITENNALIDLAQAQVWEDELEQWKRGFKDMEDEQLTSLRDYYMTLQTAVKNGEKELSDTQKKLLQSGIDVLNAELKLRGDEVAKAQSEAEQEALKAKEEALKKTAKVEESLRKKLADAEYDNA